MQRHANEAILATAAWPVVVLACPPRIEVAWIRDLERQFESVIWRRRERFALVTDSTLVESMPDALVRKALTEWAGRADQHELQKRFNVGSSTVIRNPLARGALQAMYWVWTPPAPQHAARDFDEAFEWCFGMAQKASLPTSGPVGALRAAALDELRKRGVSVAAERR